ncbi:alpha/beta fold hydrolase [Paludibacterium sp. dN 18-1]|uniref:Alpha/beta fold hydrolase n=1 Tax=Paludibacterium denitrificans TaxID=2675226 RepID=A0A844GBJ3_9NEIS|nr:alpha/beta fold hydrolase [Paludibacterium denitrificans]
MMHLVFLHGFNSSPQSLKARETAAYLVQHAPDVTFHCPQLSPHPADALQALETLLVSLPADTVLIGSSLGGFYATWLAEQHGLRAILINPAVRPYHLLSTYPGEQIHPYTGEHYTLTDDDMHTLRAHRAKQISPNRYWVILGSGDEVLDWKEAVRRYDGNRLTVFNGDDHRLARWPECLPDVLARALAAPATEQTVPA